MNYEIGDIIFIENLPIEDLIVNNGKGTVVEVYEDSIGVIFNRSKDHSIHYFYFNTENVYYYQRRVA
jgi:hypothetical protein